METLVRGPESAFCHKEQSLEISSQSDKNSWVILRQVLSYVDVKSGAAGRPVARRKLYTEYTEYIYTEYTDATLHPPPE